MGKCMIDHSHEDVLNKFQKQEEFLPANLKGEISQFLTKQASQELLNDLFHLLKKYDLASETERQERNKKLTTLING
ncbi:group-specific protein [Aquibacillus saliphilus]|uniref:group-specific protein n=1 Tax=Aquibacillus saliphilus TaxID=1909422 RepID=UPI001CF0BBB2|nr:group-specific protein [Aquibacillus saliphilus]